MNIPKAPLPLPDQSLNPLNKPSVHKIDRQVSPEMRKAAEGLESVFASQMMKAMRETVEPSEFSLHNSATDVYQGMLDQEYSDIAAHQNSLGLSEQIIDYWLRDKANPQYHLNKGVPHPAAAAKVETEASIKESSKSSTMSTGGTHEDQSNE
jgi:Rod binding domain-containing protein